MKAVQIKQPGGTDALSYTEVETPQPGEGEVLVELAAAGLNFIDIYQREGKYEVELPYILGLEGAGTITKVGANVSELKEGDRVAFAGVPGAYAEYVVAPADRLVKVPEDVELKTAAALMLQGMTAHYLVDSTYSLQAGDTCLVHAVAGGVGLLLAQLAKTRGATVIGTTSTEEKAERAREAGADHVILYTQEDFVAKTKEFTKNKGVHVVYDSVGKTTFEGSLDCLAPRGYLVLFGQSSGSVEPLDPQVLNSKGSLFLTRPSLFHYVAEREELVRRASELFELVGAGKLDVHVDSVFALENAGEAHTKLENRETSGKVLLEPQRQ